jgi:hypothetical protein
MISWKGVRRIGPIPHYEWQISQIVFLTAIKFFYFFQLPGNYTVPAFSKDNISSEQRIVEILEQLEPQVLDFTIKM